MLQIDLIAEKPGPGIQSFGRNRFLFPLFFFRKHLSRRGVRVRLNRYRGSQRPGSGQVLCLDSRALTGPGGRVDCTVLESLDRWRNEYPWIV